MLYFWCLNQKLTKREALIVYDNIINNIEPDIVVICSKKDIDFSSAACKNIIFINNTNQADIYNQIITILEEEN